MASDGESPAITYEELADIEDQFEEIDIKMMFEQAPLEIDQYIQPTDSQIFADSLKSFEVKRFEVPLGPEKIAASDGNPRSLSFKFEFEENEYFSDTVLEKKFWYRRSKEGSSGLVSEPVRINWKKGKGKDLSEGLTSMACDLWDARQRAGDMQNRDLPEYDALKKMAGRWNVGNTSFFTWFGFVSSRRYVSATESAEANAREQDRRERAKQGAKHDHGKEVDDEAEHDQDVEVAPSGEELAICLAEDLWPGATKYFTMAQEMDDEDMSDASFESESDNNDEPLDLRKLVNDTSGKQLSVGDPKTLNGKQKEKPDGGPAKRQKR
ncbi:hypothetical protein LTR28_005898 [Elasticomyces elasticus]|nr:hypothetical protein LTR28_005898 [Elasticomyces elasticus]